MAHTLAQDELHLPRRYHRVRRGQPFKHGFRFTRGGAAYVAVCFFVGLAASNSQINLLYLVFGLMLGGLIVSGVLSTLTLTGLRVYRRLPAAAMVGQVVLMAYQVVNRKRWLASYSIRLREYRSPVASSEAYLPAAPAGQPVTQRAMVLCRQRGLYRLPAITVYTRFPFSLFVHFGRFKGRDELLVYPAVGRLTHDAISLVMRTRGATQQPQPRRGGDDEFYGLREYRQGDNPRWIHWRRSARLGTLVVREMSPLSPRRLVVVISARAVRGAGRGRPGPSKETKPPGENVRLERALSLAASVLHDAVRQSFESGLIIAAPAGDGGEAVRLAAARGQHHWLAMMRALAVFEPGEPLPLSRLPRSCLRQMAGAQCLWITDGLSAGEVDAQVRALAEWNIPVRPLRAEDADFDRLVVLPAPDEQLEAMVG